MNKRSVIALFLLLHFLTITGSLAGPDRKTIIDSAKKYMGTRYNYGGTGANGFDCSGFVQRVFGENGITLPHSSEAQFGAVKKINLEEALPGDLVFFRIYRKRVSHVGIFMGDGKFIHSPSRGKRVSVADMNIPYWARRFAGAGRVLDQ
ncbi:MAG: C40 family peptidase [Spirochaetes bacterium]|jgi:cell wall-associated NlpC family hydrolase|nr:C40 family peptidase [Spirochaetota bacterium]